MIYIYTQDMVDLEQSPITDSIICSSESRCDKWLWEPTLQLQPLFQNIPHITQGKQMQQMKGTNSNETVKTNTTAVINNICNKPGEFRDNTHEESAVWYMRIQNQHDVVIETGSCYMT